MIETCSKYSENTEECDCVTGVGGEGRWTVRENTRGFENKTNELVKNEGDRRGWGERRDKRKGV